MIVDDIKEQQLIARKKKETFAVGVLTTLIGEVERRGKDAGNRLPNDDECVRIIKKFIKNANENMKLVVDKTPFEMELAILNQFVPDIVSDEDLELEIRLITSDLHNQGLSVKIGDVMRVVSEKFDNYDKKVASNLIKKYI